MTNNKFIVDKCKLFYSSICTLNFSQEFIETKYSDVVTIVALFEICYHYTGYHNESFEIRDIKLRSEEWGVQPPF